MPVPTEWTDGNKKFKEFQQKVANQVHLENEFLKQTKEAIDKVLPVVNKVKNTADTVAKYSELGSKILKGGAALSSSDKPSIFISKTFILASDVLNIIPVTNPQKEIIANGLNFAGNEIAKSEELQNAIDESIEADLENIKQADELGILPRNAALTNDFGLDVEVYVEQELREPFEKVIERNLGPQAQNFMQAAEQGDIAHFAAEFNDFADGVDPRMEEHFKEKKEMIKSFFNRHAEAFVRGYQKTNNENGDIDDYDFDNDDSQDSQSAAASGSKMEKQSSTVSNNSNKSAQAAAQNEPSTPTMTKKSSVKSDVSDPHTTAEYNFDRDVINSNFGKLRRRRKLKK